MQTGHNSFRVSGLGAGLAAGQQRPKQALQVAQQLGMAGVARVQAEAHQRPGGQPRTKAAYAETVVAGLHFR